MPPRDAERRGMACPLRAPGSGIKGKRRALPQNCHSDERSDESARGGWCGVSPQEPGPTTPSARGGLASLGVTYSRLLLRQDPARGKLGIINIAPASGWSVFSIILPEIFHAGCHQHHDPRKRPASCHSERSEESQACWSSSPEIPRRLRLGRNDISKD